MYAGRSDVGAAAARGSRTPMEPCDDRLSPAATQLSAYAERAGIAVRENCAPQATLINTS